MKLKKASRKSIALLLALVMLAGMTPIGPFAPKAAKAQMSTGQKTVANFIDIEIGSWHTLALDDEGRIYSFNAGSYNELLGRPAANNTIAVQVTDVWNEGSLEAMPFIKKISSSESVCVALDLDGNIWTWGIADRGAVNLGHPIRNLGGCQRPGKVDMPAGIKAVDIAAASGGGRFIGNDGSIYVWGHGSATTVTGSGYSLGTGFSEQTAAPKKLTQAEGGASLEGVNFLKVVSGNYPNYSVSIALAANGDVYTWGNTLNTGSVMTERGGSLRPMKVILPADIGKILKIDCGNGFWGVLDDNGDIYTWGSNSGGAADVTRLGHGGALGAHIANPRKITQVRTQAQTGSSSNFLVDAPKFKNFSMYQWAITAIDVDNQVYSIGGAPYANHNGTPASITQGDNRYLARYRPSRIPAGTEIYAVNEGWQGTAFIDSSGNLYINTNTTMHGRATTAEPWVHVLNDLTPLFTSIVSVPDENIKRYDSIRAGIAVDLSKPADEVRYVILYPNDSLVSDSPGYTFGRTFYSLSFYQVDAPYFLRGADEAILVSPNGSHMTSRYYANPAISKEVFQEAFEKKTELGEAGPLVRENAQHYTISGKFGDNCIVWLEARSGSQRTRIMLPYDDFYTPVSTYVKGVLKDTGKTLYSPQLVPGDQVSQDSYYNNPPYAYGVPLTGDKRALAYNDTNRKPPLGWDVVQPLPLISGWDIAYGEAYYKLDPDNQTNKESVPDLYGVFHRLERDKEIILNKYRFYSDPGPNAENTVTFTYSKNTDKWADAILKFVYEDGTPVPGLIDDYKSLMAPVFPAKLFDLDPFTPPSSMDPSDTAVGYFVGSLYSPPVYKPCSFP
ncbi:MAG: hypothetical protein FWF85_08115, partial [Clostridiales bacterium]|nr:hypothetical protein [Clostridiales bacterium]